MQAVHTVAEVRAAEDVLFARLPEGALMERAASGLARECQSLLAAQGVSGARVVILVGSGNNGGDALWAGARLARNGARVDAILLAPTCHEGGHEALIAAGGRSMSADAEGARTIVAAADMVIDGIVGIGGSGPLRARAAELIADAESGGAVIVAVDIPSGVSADTGAVADSDAVVQADVTVTFGCLKPGLLVWPGREYAGSVRLVDIGLSAELGPSEVSILDDEDIAACVPEPVTDAYKYSRGVVGIVAGSPRYRGAAFLAVGSARHGDAGMVQFLGRDAELSASIVDRFWDVVVTDEGPLANGRVSAWAVGPGMGEGPDDRALLLDTLQSASPVLIDADGLRLLADPVGPARQQLIHRHADGLLTVLTPHVGEFAGLGFTVGSGSECDRLGAARAAASSLRAVVVLKGPGTVIASPDGQAYIDTRGGAELGTAGSGDVLSGLTGALLAGAHARGELLDEGSLARVVAGAVALHGLAGSRAAAGGRPITAMDIVDALPNTIAEIRRGGIR